MLYETFLSAKPLTRVAAILFVMGKICCFFTVLSALISYTAASVFLVVYIICIVGAIVLTLIDISAFQREATEEKKTPSLKQVKKWVEEYGLKVDAK